MDIETLRGIPLFAELDDDGLDVIARLATEFEAQAGRVLAEIGQPGSGLFVIEDGTVEVDMPDGAVVELGPGEFFGEVALLTDSPRNARVRALTDVRCLAISRHVFMLLLDAQPRIAATMLPIVARRLSGH
ncbi:MAG TPA: cyclic nucleotide-binding domain-containing protein [Actinomycetota bacterium]|nr:cyclic nucleotide-binding domain-containing protein [Actinomycetota bacterium]